jgi:hypothetical protein
MTLPTIMKSITLMGNNITTLISFISNCQTTIRPDIVKVLKKRDVEKSIILLHTIIEEIPKYYEVSDSIVLALKNVEEIVEQIEKELQSIQEKIIYNSNLFMKFRSYDFQENIESMEINMEILENRKENLFRTLTIFKK